MIFTAPLKDSHLPARCASSHTVFTLKPRGKAAVVPVIRRDHFTKQSTRVSAISYPTASSPSNAQQSHTRDTSSKTPPSKRAVPDQVHLQPKDDQALQQLFDDLAADVCCRCHVTSRVTSTGRGLVAQRDIARGHAAVSVDDTHLLCVAENPQPGAFSTQQLNRWQQRHGPLPTRLEAFLLDGSVSWFDRLTALLLWALSCGAPMWTLYRCILPTADELTVLMCYKQHELQELQNDQLADTARLQMEATAKLHNRLFGVGGRLCDVGVPCSPDPELTLWAAALVSTRSFSETVGAERCAVLCPAADMANHSVTPNAGFMYSAQQQQFQLVAMKGVYKGEQLCISYGCNDRSNNMLMSSYGFIIPGNTNERLHFDFPGGRIPLIRAALLMTALGLHATVTPTGSHLHQFNGKWYAAMEPKRSVAIPGTAWQPRDDHVGMQRQACVLHSMETLFAEGRTGPLSASQVDAERESVEMLMQQCRDILDSHGISIEADEQLLVGGQLSPRHEMAVRYRLERKTLAATALGMLTAYNNALKYRP